MACSTQDKNRPFNSEALKTKPKVSSGSWPAFAARARTRRSMPSTSFSPSRYSWIYLTSGSTTVLVRFCLEGLVWIGQLRMNHHGTTVASVSAVQVITVTVRLSVSVCLSACLYMCVLCLCAHVSVCVCACLYLHAYGLCDYAHVKFACMSTEPRPTGIGRSLLCRLNPRAKALRPAKVPCTERGGCTAQDMSWEWLHLAQRPDTLHRHQHESRWELLLN